MPSQNTAATEQRKPLPSRIDLYRSATETKPRSLIGTWLDLVELLTTHQRTICTAETCAGKECTYKRGEAFNAAELRPGTTRASKNVIRVHTLLFDVDGLTPTEAKALIARLKAAGLACVVSSTHSHRPSAPQLRAAFALSRPALASEYATLWASANEHLGMKADPATKDSARIFFRPTAPADVKPFVWSQAGAPLDVDRFLAIAPAAARVKRAPLTGAEWVALVDGLAEGGRNDGLSKLAGLLFRSLPGALAARLLYMVNDTIVPPLEDAEVSAIVASIARREAQRLAGAR